MARQGMDVEVVEAVAKTMHEKAQSTTSIVESAGRLIRGSEKLWLGQRADRWLADWLVEEAAVRRAAGFLEEMSKRLSEQANDQKRGSAGRQGGSGRKGGSYDPFHGHRPRSGSKGEVADRAALANAGYSDAKTPDGWLPLDSMQMKALGITAEDLHSLTAMDAAVYINSEGHYVLSFTGTEMPNPLDVADWVNNAGSGGLTLQDINAITLAKKVSAATNGNVEFTGHSLGGRLAALAALATDGKATTFDAAGVSLAAQTAARTVSPGGLFSGGAQIDNYYADSDPLTMAQKAAGYTPIGMVMPGAIGDQHVVHADSGHSFGQGGHSMGDLANQLDREADRAGQ